MLEIAFSGIPDVSVLMAPSAVEALRILHNGTAIQAIVTDLNMPRMDGYELIRRVREDRKLAATPIIVVSADTDPATPDRIAALGVEEQAQTKVESSQKYPIRLAGMALFNAFMNSKQSGGADYPVVAGATGVGHSGATVRQSIVGLEFQDPGAVLGGKAHGSIYMDFYAGADNNAFR